MASCMDPSLLDTQPIRAERQPHASTLIPMRKESCRSSITDSMHPIITRIVCRRYIWHNQNWTRAPGNTCTCVAMIHVSEYLASSVCPSGSYEQHVASCWLKFEIVPSCGCAKNTYGPPTYSYILNLSRNVTPTTTEHSISASANSAVRACNLYY